jgi:hypothetical protein
MKVSDQSLEYTQSLVKQLKSFQFPEKVTKQVVLGFDGYVDNLLSVVKIRKSPTSYEIMESMKVWANRILEAAGSSASIERILKKQATGGFTCNVGKALATLCGCSGNIQLIGAYGHPNHLPIFANTLELEKKCKLQSIGEPGVTDAYEFSDGKVMMVNFGSIHTIDWQYILSHVNRDALIEYFKSSALYGIGYWASTPHGTSIYQGLQTDILPNLPKSIHNQYLLLDLSDLKKRASEDLSQLKSLFQGFENFIHVILLLNDKELTTLHDFLKNSKQIKQGKSWNELKSVNIDDKIEFFKQMTSNIREYYGIESVICHSSHFSTIATQKRTDCVLNSFQPNPKFTTSAGDHFTAGVGYGLLLNMPLELLPLLGNMNASNFVVNGISPDNKIFHASFIMDLLENRNI